jgi:branched-chain amino acid transport system permease protein
MAGHELFQVMLSGVLLGSLYGLAAAGLNLFMAASGRVNLAFGHVWMLAALAVSALLALGFMPPALAVGAVALAWAAAAWIAHPGRLWTARNDGGAQRSFFLVSLGLALVMEDAGQRLAPLPVTALAMAPPPFQAAGMVMSPVRVAACVLLVFWAAVLAAFLRFNRWGKALRAWDHGDGPLWVAGVNPVGLGKRAMALSSGLAGLSGALFCFGYTVGAQEGMAMTLRCLCVAAAAGGIDPLRVMAAGLGLGLAEAVVGHAVGSQWMAIVPCALLLLIVPLREIKNQWAVSP